jgi:hypothetical protein
MGGGAVPGLFLSYPRGTLRAMEDRDSCPTWCARHTVSRCRSVAFSVAGWCHGHPVDVAVQLEQRGGDPVLALLQPDRPPIWLPAVEAVRWVAAAQRLVDAAGWTPVDVRR